MIWDCSMGEGLVTEAPWICLVLERNRFELETVMRCVGMELEWFCEVLLGVYSMASADPYSCSCKLTA